jgi:DNA polymerase-3 subunit delta
LASIKQPRVFSVFYGEESYLLDRELSRALKWPDRVVTSLDGGEATEDAVISALQDLPLEEERGVVVVLDNADKVKIGAGLLAYADQRDPKDRSALLVAVCRSSHLSKGWSELARRGRAVEHPKFKPWEKNKIKERLFKETAALGFSLEEPAFDVLFTIYGDQMGSMINSIRKVSLLLEKGKAISKDLVLSLCSQRYAVAPWDVSDAAMAKDSKRALRKASMLFQEQGDEALVPIVASMMKKLEQTVLIRALLDRGQSPEAIGTALGIHAYRIQKELPSVKKHTVPQLLEQMKKICELEVQIKGAAPSKRTLVELAVLSLAA